MKALKIFFIAFSLISFKAVYGQVGITQTPTTTVKSAETYYKYNSVTFGSFGGKSITDKATSLTFYNYNQISFTNRTFLSSYAEYYNDWNNVFYGNYLNAQALINYKLPKMVIVGIGYRYHNNFDVNVKQNFIQFKIEKSFSWK